MAWPPSSTWSHRIPRYRIGFPRTRRCASGNRRTREQIRIAVKALRDAMSAPRLPRPAGAGDRGALSATASRNMAPSSPHAIGSDDPGHTPAEAAPATAPGSSAEEIVSLPQTRCPSAPAFASALEGARTPPETGTTSTVRRMTDPAGSRSPDHPLAGADDRLRGLLRLRRLLACCGGLCSTRSATLGFRRDAPP